MKPLFTAVLMVLLSIVSVSVQAATGVSTRVRLSSNVTLPAVPVSFHVAMTNGTDRAVQIPSRAALVVRPPAGQEFVSKVVTIEPPMEQLAPNGRVDFDIATDGAFLRPAWFQDSRLQQPGEYQLQLFFSDVLLGEMSAETVRRISLVASNKVTLTVQEPRGDDAEVWRRMAEFSGGTWHPMSLSQLPGGDTFVRSIVAEFPESRYTPWLATMGTTGSAEENAAFLRAYLAKHPKDPMYATRLLRVAEWEIFLADKYSMTDRIKAESYEEKAKSTLREVLRSSREASVRGRAQDRLAYLEE